MTQIEFITELTEETETILHELQILGEQLFIHLRHPMQSIQTGRSPRHLGLAEQLLTLTESLPAFGDCLKDLARCAKHWASLAKQSAGAGQDDTIKNALSQLNQQHLFWQEYNLNVRNLVDKLRLVSQQDSISSLGRMPIEDIWGDIQRMSELN